MFSFSDIQLSLSNTYPSLKLLESASITDKRYKEKNIIIFEYENIANESCVLKFYSLQHIVELERENEKLDLLEEFRCIKRLGSTPHVVRVYDASEFRIDGHLVGFYLTMEKFDGTLAALIKERTYFNSNEVTDFLRQMGEVLDLAHYRIKQPVIHADIKPSNIGYRFIEKDIIEYALMDFDISVTMQPNVEDHSVFTLSNKGTIRGVSLSYAPPEQVLAYVTQSGSISNRVDIYAVGAIAMEMLTGLAPNKSEAQFSYELPFHKLSGEWVQIFAQLNHADPKQRAKRVSDAFNPSSVISVKKRRIYQPALLLLSFATLAIMIAVIYMILKSSDAPISLTEIAVNRDTTSAKVNKAQSRQDTQPFLIDRSDVESRPATSVPDTKNSTLDKTPAQAIPNNTTSNLPVVSNSNNSESATSSVGQYGNASHGTDARVIKETNLNSYTYNTVLATWSGPGGSSYWLTQNLGSTMVPRSDTDLNPSSSGWYFQFNNPLAFTGTENLPLGEDLSRGNWLANNDPCRILLGSNWRIPTVTEWENFVRAPQSSGGVGRGYSKDAFNSLLKLHLSGFLSAERDRLTQYREVGLYWSANEASAANAYAIVIGSRNAVVREVPKTSALSLRCIQNN